MSKPDAPPKTGHFEASGPGSLRRDLPDKPIVTIEPSRLWLGLDLKELWEHRDLLYFLTWRDIKVRYKQTLLGAAWAVMQPLFTMLIFTLFFGKLANVPSDGIPYPIFAYAGLLPWIFFANAITNSGNCLVGSTNLITKVYFPRMMIPAAVVCAGLLDLAIASVLMVGMMLFFRIAPSWNVLLLPVLVLLVTVLALGVGMWMSALNVRYRDIRYALPFVVQLWMFISPVIYPTSLVPQKWRWMLALNPLTGLIENFRVAFLGRRTFDWPALGISTAITLMILLYAIFAFRRTERSFADVI